MSLCSKTQLTRYIELGQVAMYAEVAELGAKHARKWRLLRCISRSDRRL